MADKRVVRIAVIVALAILALAGAIAMQLPDGDRDSPAVPRVAAGSGDWLDEELERCRALGPGDRPDKRCEAAWAESRRRFFGDYAKEK